MDNYITSQGDTWDIISMRFYDDPFYTKQLMQSNPTHIKTLIFAEGVELEIPEVEASANSTLPPWKQV